MLFNIHSASGLWLATRNMVEKMRLLAENRLFFLKIS
jgi:hypothetical protein